ncbi:MAG: thioesterase domain-containing protein [Bacteroidota bacterium]
MKKVKLFCFPFAGGSARYYKDWQRLLSDSIVLRPVELAGRGQRIGEALYSDMQEMIDDLYAIIEPELHDLPYALFGHSMGGVIAFELMLRIQQENKPMPRHFFASGRNAPHLKKERKHYHSLSEEAFKTEILKLGGAPVELFEEPELADLFLPMLRNDFRLAETYAFLQKEIQPFDFGITVFVGKEEDYSAQEIAEWHRHTNKMCAIYYFPGGHFFINSFGKEITGLINRTMKKISSQRIYSPT